MTNIDERAEFEKWVSKFGADLTPANKESIFERSYTYESDQTEAAWDGWQARANLPTAGVSEDDVVEIMARAVYGGVCGVEQYRKLVIAYRALSDNGYNLVRK